MLAEDAREGLFHPSRADPGGRRAIFSKRIQSSESRV
jgi:hypothetical protein